MKMHTQNKPEEPIKLKRYFIILYECKTGSAGYEVM